MNYLSAKERVQRFIAERASDGDDWIVIDDQTTETSFGWVFCYDSKKFIETGELIYALAGNAPIIFDNRDESMHVTGTSKGIGFYIKRHQENYLPQGKHVSSGCSE